MNPDVRRNEPVDRVGDEADLVIQRERLDGVRHRVVAVAMEIERHYAKPWSNSLRELGPLRFRAERRMKKNHGSARPDDERTATRKASAWTPCAGVGNSVQFGLRVHLRFSRCAAR